MSFDIGQKVVCIDDRFHPQIAALYTALPKEGSAYVVRDVRIGIHHPGGQGDVSLLLVGVVNPKANSKASLERGFSETRFRAQGELNANEPAKTVRTKRKELVEA